MSTSNAQHLSAQRPSSRENSKRVEGLKRWSRRDDGVASTSPFRRVISFSRLKANSEQLHSHRFGSAGFPSRGGEADDFLFAPDGERAFCRRQKSTFNVFPGAGDKIAAATHVELALNIFAMALNGFYTEMK